MIVDITPIVAVFFKLILFLIGVDFLWCGYWYIKTQEIKLTLGFLGYLALMLFKRANSLRKSSNQDVNSIFSMMFSMQSAGIYLVVAGICLIMEGLFSLLTQLLR
ncbi:MAG TPA: hypothetical protein VGK00_16910 [Anaerolineales bacterium]